MRPIIKQSGTKHTVKVTHGIANSLSSIRSKHISPMKGTRNPAHIHVNIKHKNRG